MAVIGLTGGSGAGKTTVASLFRACGCHIIDADAVARHVVEPGMAALDEIVSHFGPCILLPDGTLDRRKLGRLVFSNANERRVLNRITHRYISAEIEQAIAAVNGTVVIDAALLIESGLADRCDMVVSVLAEWEVRLSRIMKRDNLSREDAANRLQSQPDDQFYRDHSAIILYNNNEADLQRMRICVQEICTAQK